MKKVELTKEELKELIGGQLSLQSVAAQDVNNSNTTFGCQCTYNNKSVISNSNSSNSCECLCR